jgi:23S rRNA (adenine2503-C2)-methyltransferase
MEEKTLIYNLSQPELVEIITGWGEPAYRARQIWQGLYQNLWNNPEQFTSLSLPLRKRLGETFSFSYLQPETVLKSKDNQTEKTLFRLPDNQPIETVLMIYEQRRTLCISTQAGCAMGCVFCATGQMGFRRNLTAGEIVEQVLYYGRQLAGRGERVTNIVVMGMGEPFHNYDSTMEAIDRLGNHEGYNLGARRFTVSTVGLIPMIKRFAKEQRQVGLAVSLHAADDELRSSMLPINKKYPIGELLDACREYVDKTKRRITFEWALIRDVNDSPDQARMLAERLKGLLCHVNVIPLNPTEKYEGKATTQERARLFQKELESRGVSCTIRLRRGIDIKAGCGQLAGDQKQHAA